MDPNRTFVWVGEIYLMRLTNDNVLIQVGLSNVLRQSIHSGLATRNGIGRRWNVQMAAFPNFSSKTG